MCELLTETHVHALTLPVKRMPWLLLCCDSQLKHNNADSGSTYITMRADDTWKVIARAQEACC
jgi:hypothetical protein